ncbi:unnamed protein product [Rotaria sp. Silwood2]|nr:unnamed protein product [Rotaria sp. Silwood2]
MIGSQETEELARQAIMKKVKDEEALHARFWDVAPLMIDSFTAYVVKGNKSPVAGIYPYSITNPNGLVITCRFESTTKVNAKAIATKLLSGAYEIEIGFFFAGFMQVSTNFVSIMGDQLQRVLQKTAADGNNTNALYIHRSQATKFTSQYLANVKKMIYQEQPNANISQLISGLEDQFTSLFHEGMSSTKETRLEANLFEEVWSSSDLDPDRLVSELSNVMTYNESASEAHNFSDKYFNINQQSSSASSSQGSGFLGGIFKGFGINLGGSGGSTSSSSHANSSTSHEVLSLSEIQHQLDQSTVEFEWTGEKFIPKAFMVYKLVDLTDQLSVAIFAKELLAQKQNGAVIHSVSGLVTPITPSSPPPRFLTGEIKLYSGSDIPPAPWMFCDGAILSRVTYKRLFAVIGLSYNLAEDGDNGLTFRLPDFRGRVPLGVDEFERRVLHAKRIGAAGGESMPTLSAEQLPTHQHASGSLTTSNGGEHSHNIYDPGHNHGGRTGNALTTTAFGSSGFSNGKFWYMHTDIEHSHQIPTGKTDIFILNSTDHNHNVMGHTASVGSGLPLSVVQPFQTVNYIIYTGD